MAVFDAAGRIAWRLPLVVVMSGVFSRVCACFTESQLPIRTPLDATPFSRVIPAAIKAGFTLLAGALLIAGAILK